MNSVIRIAAACALAWTAHCLAQPQGGTQAIVVGAVVSESGANARAAADYRKALLLWQDEVNAGGGLLGRRIELRLANDGSEAVRAGPLYAQLIRDKADLLIGPYGSAATMMAAAEAERARRVMMNGSGAARAVHKKSPRYLFQVLAPYTAYGAGALELAASAGCKSIFISGRDDPISSDMAQGAADMARLRGMAVTLEFFSAGTTEFAPMVANARVAQAQGWLAFGELRDAVEIVKARKLNDFAASLFHTPAVSQPNFISMVGQEAERTLGPVRYEARLATPGNAAFAKAFAAKWSAAPGAAAAEAYAAATVLAEAVRRAGTLEQQKLRATLAELEHDTVLGRYKVDPASGEQVGIRPAVAQIVKGRPQIVWPAALKTAEADIRCR